MSTAGNHYAKSAFSEELDLDHPEYATPLGIAVSAGLGLLNDSYLVMLNGQPAKLFRSGTLTLRDILLMNGYTYEDILGRSGRVSPSRWTVDVWFCGESRRHRLF